MYSTPLPTEATEIHDLCREWLAEFSKALVRNDASAIANLFQDVSHWRDVLAFTWHLTTVNGAQELASYLCAAQTATRATGFALDAERTPPRRVTRAGTECLGQQDLLRLLFGDAIAERAGPVWGFSDDGELANMWKRSGQPGLWFIAGSLD